MKQAITGIILFSLFFQGLFCFDNKCKTHIYDHVNTFYVGKTPQESKTKPTKLYLSLINENINVPTNKTLFELDRKEVYFGQENLTKQFEKIIFSRPTMIIWGDQNFKKKTKQQNFYSSLFDQSNLQTTNDLINFKIPSITVSYSDFQFIQKRRKNIELMNNNLFKEKKKEKEKDKEKEEPSYLYLIISQNPRNRNWVGMVNTLAGRKIGNQFDIQVPFYSKKNLRYLIQKFTNYERIFRMNSFCSFYSDCKQPSSRDQFTSNFDNTAKKQNKNKNFQNPIIESPKDQLYIQKMELIENKDHLLIFSNNNYKTKNFQIDKKLVSKSPIDYKKILFIFGITNAFLILLIYFIFQNKKNRKYNLELIEKYLTLNKNRILQRESNIKSFEIVDVKQTTQKDQNSSKDQNSFEDQNNIQELIELKITSIKPNSITVQWKLLQPIHITNSFQIIMTNISIDFDYAKIYTKNKTIQINSLKANNLYSIKILNHINDQFDIKSKELQFQTLLIPNETISQVQIVEITSSMARIKWEPPTDDNLVDHYETLIFNDQNKAKNTNDEKLTGNYKVNGDDNEKDNQNHLSENQKKNQISEENKPIKTVNSIIKRCKITDLKPESPYFFQIKSINKNGTQFFSRINHFQTKKIDLSIFNRPDKITKINEVEIKEDQSSIWTKTLKFGEKILIYELKIQKSQNKSNNEEKIYPSILTKFKIPAISLDQQYDFNIDAIVKKTVFMNKRMSNYGNVFNNRKKKKSELFQIQEMEILTSSACIEWGTPNDKGYKIDFYEIYLYLFDNSSKKTNYLKNKKLNHQILKHFNFKIQKPKIIKTYLPTCKITKLKPYKIYYFKIRAHNRYGYSDFSELRSFETFKKIYYQKQRIKQIFLITTTQLKIECTNFKSFSPPFDYLEMSICPNYEVENEVPCKIIRSSNFYFQIPYLQLEENYIFSIKKRSINKNIFMTESYLNPNISARIINSIKIIKVTSNSVNIRWEKSYENDLMIDFYVIQLQFMNNQTGNNGHSKELKTLNQEANKSDIFISFSTRTKISNLKQDQTYSIRIRTHIKTGFTNFSESKYFKTKRPIPTPIQQIKAIPLLSNQNLIKWTKPNDNGYKIDFYEVNIFSNVDNKVDKPDNFTYFSKHPNTLLSVNNLQPNQNYLIKIRSHNKFGFSPFSKTFNFKTKSILTNIHLKK
ncbi:fibronectin type iii domain-containing 3ba-related [Anaeramoeba flamelloides]|uniref:Fibronectin type iii domain-containing 3ba-related n=1 Tax=Anaeramoeba flamelloides TaxID=1746091 RepID=A0ABQ8XX88_9EUKA|nr:fibronectin type iii domain-containing 3ba-related [Anaeramoeba flamelloides]